LRPVLLIQSIVGIQPPDAVRPDNPAPAETRSSVQQTRLPGSAPAPAGGPSAPHGHGSRESPAAVAPCCPVCRSSPGVPAEVGSCPSATARATAASVARLVPQRRRCFGHRCPRPPHWPGPVPRLPRGSVAHRPYRSGCTTCLLSPPCRGLSAYAPSTPPVRSTT